MDGRKLGPAWTLASRLARVGDGVTGGTGSRTGGDAGERGRRRMCATTQTGVQGSLADVRGSGVFAKMQSRSLEGGSVLMVLAFGGSCRRGGTALNARWRRRELTNWRWPARRACSGARCAAVALVRLVHQCLCRGSGSCWRGHWTEELESHVCRGVGRGSYSPMCAEAVDGGSWRWPRRAVDVDAGRGS